MRGPLVWFFLLGILGAAVVGCGGGGTSLGVGSNANQGGGGTVNQAGTAAIRIINGSPDFGPIDVYIDNVRVWQNVSYGNFVGRNGGVTTPPYFVTSVQGAPLAPAAHTVSIYAAGAAQGNFNQQAAVSTLPGSTRTTVVVADKTFGGPTAPPLQAVAFPEPVLAAAPGLNANVIIHHAAPVGAPGLMAYGKLTVTQSTGGTTIRTSCIGNITFANPPSITDSIRILRKVNTGTTPIGYYVAPTGFGACRRAFAEFFPASTATPPPVPLVAGASPPPSLNGFPNSGIVFPTPFPNPPGQPSPAPFDCDSTLPPLCHGLPPNPNTVPPNPLAVLPNLSLYAIDAPPVPPATIPGVLIIGVFDSNSP